MQKPQTASAALTEKERSDLRALAQREGLPTLAVRFGVHREALARALAGLGTRRGTIALIRAALDRAATSPPRPAA